MSRQPLRPPALRWSAIEPGTREEDHAFIASPRRVCSLSPTVWRAYRRATERAAEAALSDRI